MSESLFRWKRAFVPSLRDVRVGCAILAWSVWMGGFMFYFGVVVPTGGAIVGGSEQGFVTQQVTFKLNFIGVAALAVMTWNTWVARNRWLVVSLIIMSLCHVGLFVMHHQLTLRISVPSREILSQSQFASLHESYEGLCTVQWIAAIAHLVGMVRASNPSSGLSGTAL